MDIQQQGSFSALSGKLRQLRTINSKAKVWASSSAADFEAALKDRYANPSPPRSSATNFLRSQMPSRSDRPTDKIELKKESSATGSSATVGIATENEMLALMQEHGATVTVTPAMRGFLGAHGLHLRGTTKAIHIPARRPWRKTWIGTSPSAIKNLKNIFKIQ